MLLICVLASVHYFTLLEICLTCLIMYAAKILSTGVRTNLFSGDRFKGYRISQRISHSGVYSHLEPVKMGFTIHIGCISRTLSVCRVLNEITKITNQFLGG